MKKIISYRNFYILFSLFLLIAGCNKTNNADPITGKWTLTYQSSLSFPDSAGAIIYASSTPNYNNDTFDITFSQGKFSSKFPGNYFVVNNSLQTIWSDGNGTYSIHDNNILEISTEPSASLHQFLHLGFPVWVQSTTIFKMVQPDRLLILSTYGKLNVFPFGYDSTILIRH